MTTPLSDGRNLYVPAAVLILALLLLWLGGIFAFLPSDAAVARAFEKRHPGFRAIKVLRGSGDPDGLSFQIQYRTSEAGNLRTAHWLVYTSGVQLGWKLDSEELDQPAMPGPVR